MVPHLSEIICSKLEKNLLQAMNPMSDAPQTAPEWPGGICKAPKDVRHQVLPSYAHLVLLHLLAWSFALIRTM